MISCLTRRLVVADSVPRLQAQNSATSTLDSGTANMGRSLPDNLGKVTIVAERNVGGGVGHAIEVGIVWHLAVVPLVADTLGSRLDLQVVNVAA